MSDMRLKFLSSVPQLSCLFSLGLYQLFRMTNATYRFRFAFFPILLQYSFSFIWSRSFQELPPWRCVVSSTYLHLCSPSADVPLLHPSLLPPSFPRFSVHQIMGLFPPRSGFPPSRRCRPYYRQWVMLIVIPCAS